MQLKLGRPKLRELFIFLFMGLMVAVDQYTKILADANLVMHAPPVKAIPYILNFRLLYNEGAAFGMLSNHRYIFMSVTCVVVAAGLVLLLFRGFEKSLVAFPVAMVVAGGIGNLIDRFYLGYVIDFFEFDFVEFSIFNVADCCVVVGASLLILYFIIEFIVEFRQKTAATNQNEEDEQENPQLDDSETPMTRSQSREELDRILNDLEGANRSPSEPEIVEKPVIEQIPELAYENNSPEIQVNPVPPADVRKIPQKRKTQLSDLPQDIKDVLSGFNQKRQ